jgi:N-acetylglucosamine-6-phosphate deacetylase
LAERSRVALALILTKDDVMGCFDLQVNGYGGVDYNQDALTSDELHRSMTVLQRDDVDGILATIITEKLDVMCRRIARIVQLRESDPLAAKIIQGIHVEGPFISADKGYVGAHPSDSVIPADLESTKKLLDAGKGFVKLLTLAPENDAGAKVTSFLAKQGIRVSAGHTDASRDQLKAAIEAGMTLFTHLGNGCPPILPRHDNIIQRALSLREHLTMMFIADGAHIPFFALRNYLDLVGTYKSIVVTDAIAPAGLGPGQYTISRWQVNIGEDLVARSPDKSHLIGSAMSMPQAIANLEKHVGLSAAQICKLVDTNPRLAMGLEGMKGDK